MPFLFEDDQKTIISLDAAMQPLVTRLTTNFQNKINAIYEKLVTLGSTPSAKTPEAITNAIQAINDSIFNKLVSLGQTPASKTVANLNAKIQALTEIQWQQSFGIAQQTYTESGETKVVPTRDVPFNCRDLVNILIAFTYIYSEALGSHTYSMGSISWYNASGTLISTNSFDVTVSGIGTANYSQTFTPPSGAVRAVVQFRYYRVQVEISNTPTATFKYQTKVLR